MKINVFVRQFEQYIISNRPKKKKKGEIIWSFWSFPRATKAAAASYVISHMTLFASKQLCSGGSQETQTAQEEWFGPRAAGRDWTCLLLPYFAWTYQRPCRNTPQQGKYHCPPPPPCHVSSQKDQLVGHIWVTHRQGLHCWNILGSNGPQMCSTPSGSVVPIKVGEVLKYKAKKKSMWQERGGFGGMCCCVWFLYTLQKTPTIFTKGKEMNNQGCKSGLKSLKPHGINPRKRKWNN